MERQDSTLPQFRCGECGAALSASVHYQGDHSWKIPKGYEEFWASKDTGLMPIGGTDGK